MQPPRPSTAVRTLCISLLSLLGYCGAGSAQQQGPSPTVQNAMRTPHAPEPAAPRRSAADVARWNDRTTPRRTLETFFFAIYCYDLAPELIVNAIDCLDYSGVGKFVKEQDAALMAHELNSIVCRHDVALYSVPDEKVDGEEWTLATNPTQHITLQRQKDGRWRFDARTVREIGTMRLESVRGQRQAQEARLKLAEGRTDPEATMRTFLTEIVRHDFTAAARCLDLRDFPLKLRATQGPELARKLFFVIQRCRFVFPQEIISDPDGWRYIWHSNHRGRIVLDRVRQEDGKDAWVFNRGTLRNLDALVEGFRNSRPDPRYAFLGVVMEPSMLAEGDRTSWMPPSSVPGELGSPRATLRTFLENMDELEFDDVRTRMVLSCMSLGEISESDRTSVGLRLAAKLDAILQHLNLDLLSVPDSWKAEPQTYGGETEWQVKLACQSDGAWRFDPDTIARVPEMFDRLPTDEKSRKDRGSRFGTARQTVRTFLLAVSRGDDRLAARALDLTAIPERTQADIGPTLARKLKFVIDTVGPIRIQEVPNEIEGPRHLLYRGPLGRISLESAVDGSRKGEWLFTAETVAQVEPMFLSTLGQSTSARLPESGTRQDPITAASLGLLLRSHIPAWLRVSVAGLDSYQWIGLALILLLSGGVAWIVFRTIDLFVIRLLRKTHFDLSSEFVRTKLQPLAWQLALFLVTLQLGLLDLPISVWSAILPMMRFVWIGLMAWTAIRLVDLFMAVYTNSEQLQHRRNLSDMIVPTAARFLKLAFLIAAVSWEVYLIGNGEWVTRLLAGLGLVGLAASLAAQDTLKNFFGTLLLIGEHPFKIGDFIVVNKMEGTVESVGFRSTWIRTPDDSLITIPNSIIATASIDNRGARNSRRYRTFLSLDYKTPLDDLIALRDSLRDYALGHPLIRADKIEICIHTLSSAGVELLVSLYFKVSTGQDELAARDELNREILDQARRLGVEIAPPAQTMLIPHAAEADRAIPAPKLSLLHNGASSSGNGESVPMRRDT
jgi:MscS family membrane protein